MATELELKKLQADDLGIAYNARIGLKKLTAKVANELAKRADAPKEEVVITPDEPGALEEALGVDKLEEIKEYQPIHTQPTSPVPEESAADKLVPAIVKALESASASAVVPATVPVVDNTPKPLTEQQIRDKAFLERKKNASRLIRIKVMCMNPTKKDWPGEIISVGSAKLGTYKKYVPFNTVDGWHVPNIIYETMRDRMCSIFYTVPASSAGGIKTRKAKQTNEFAIEVMDPLTNDEMKDLATRQAMSGSIDKD